MSTYINFNGNLTDPSTPVATIYNRSLRFGDGLFETMYWNGREIENLDFHMDRLFQGLQALEFDLSGGFSREFIGAETIRLCEINCATLPARARLNIFREDGNTLLPAGNKPVFLIETGNLPALNHVPLRMTIFKSETKSTGLLSNLKTNNYLLNLLAVQHAKRSGYDDALILNNKGNICEASTSNLFAIQRGILFTPALAQGCVAGTKRRQLLETLPGLSFQIEETILTKDMIYEMEEVFLSNAVAGIRPVICIDNTYYTRELTTIIMQMLNSPGT